jgi:putative membrane-bound dehydrogenase-like protein
MKVDGSIDWPTAEQIQKTDVIVAYAQDGGDATPEQETLINNFVKRGGGLVVIHTAAVSFKNPGWWRDTIGGAWVPGKSKWREGAMDLYFSESQHFEGGHPITRDASNFHFDDEIYYDLDILPGVRVLATSYTPNVLAGKKPDPSGQPHIFDIQPQMWAYEKTAEGGSKPYRAFVSIPGHRYQTFERPNYRAILLRGIAWAGKRANLDEFCRPEELSALRYPEGGPQKPEETLKSLDVHPDFNLTLVAAEPLITKPMNFDWAPDGSLWVAETPEYPNGRRGMRPDYRGREWKDLGGIDPTPGVQDRPARDTISRLIDTDGDGKMDKKEVFYEGLDLVTGFVFHKDGVIVTQAPDILWLRDTNGDGKADKVEKLYGGLGTADTHAVINNPRWGWDGWIYATHGYSASDHVVNAEGEKQPRIGSGVVRFKPDGSAIEQYSSKGGNTWGLQITADNRVMWTQPTSGQLLMHTVLPEYALARGKFGDTASFHVVEPSGKTFPLISWEQLAYVQIDWVGSFTAAAGTVIYDGGTWPAEYNGDYFTTEPTINIVHHTRLSPQGSSYTAKKLPGREETEFIRSRDMWWRPIEVRVGPDGAVYIGDFYNQAVIHNDTRGPDHNKVNAAVRPDRDHYFGRIWKLDHKQAKKVAAPNLAKAGVSELARALEHPNRSVKMTASRLLSEAVTEKKARRELVADAIASHFERSWAKTATEARIASLWTLASIGSMRAGLHEKAVSDPDSDVRRNAALVVEAAGGRKFGELLNDGDPQVRLAALRALAANEFTGETAKALVSSWPKLDDDFQRSAAIGAASQNPSVFIAAALDAANATELAPVVAALVQKLTDAEDAAKLIVVLAGKPESADGLKRTILDGLAQTVRQKARMTAELRDSLKKLLKSSTAGPAAVLGGRWDESGDFAGDISALIEEWKKKVSNATASQTERHASALSLLAMREFQPKIVGDVAKLLGEAEISASAKASLIAALGETGDAVVGLALVNAFGSLDANTQAGTFDVLLKRSEWTNALLDAVKGGTVSLANLGPAQIARLRTHPDPAVSKRAGEMLEQLNPTAKAKNEVIAKLASLVEQPGDVAKGKAAFATTCAICHKFGDVGVDVGPVLTGMGSHGRSELLTAIVDPNREVDPSFTTWNIETKGGQFFTGIVARENSATILLRSLAGQQEVKVADIKTRVNTGRSLMPEGFDALGGEALRDIIAYMASVDGGRFRTLDLKEAFTASTAHGLYDSHESKAESFVFTKSGTVNVEGVPFHVVTPERAETGRNVIVLKGGPSPKNFSNTMPQRVEIQADGFKANRLHFLGGVTGWGFKNNDDRSPVLKITVNYADGGSEEISCHNAAEFADYIERIDVPKSKFVDGLVRERQIRWFTKPLKRTGPLASLVLESFGTSAVPTLAAITAELAEPNAPLPANGAASDDPPVAAARWPSRQYIRPTAASGERLDWLRVLLVGGGTSHDFARWFGDKDKEILAALKPARIEYTESMETLQNGLPDWDVVVVSTNQPLSSEARRTLMEVANTGRGIVLLHPGIWYNWPNFPEWNRDLVGGGSRGHDKYGEFEVEVLDAKHPLTVGLPPRFKISDELYYFTPDPQGAPIQVLAQAASTTKGQAFPQVWAVTHPKARIAAITLGHDAKAHELPEFQTLLRNAVRWVSGKM